MKQRSPGISEKGSQTMHFSFITLVLMIRAQIVRIHAFLFSEYCSRDLRNYCSSAYGSMKLTRSNRQIE
jgi:hypothetical protein